MKIITNMTENLFIEDTQRLSKPKYVEIAVDHVMGHPEGTECHEIKKHRIRLGTYLIPESGEGASHEADVTEENIKYRIGQLLAGSTFLHD